MSDTVVLTAKQSDERPLEDEDDELLKQTFEKRQAWLKSRVPISSRRGGADDPDAPLDLRVSQPQAYDLRQLWALTGQPEPPTIAAALGPNIPILLEHIVTPFASDGGVPNGVWGLGYEFILTKGEAITKAVVPSEEVLRVGQVGQKVELALSMSGGIEVPQVELPISDAVPGISLSGAKLCATTHQTFQFSLQISLSLRKVVGAPVGVGGAQWKLYRQDEPLDRPHYLYQMLLVSAGTVHLDCVIRAWARSAGWFGTALRSRYYSYQDQAYRIDLNGLGNSTLVPT